MRASQMDVSKSLEQEEPFDLSQKRQGEGLSFHSDGESAKGSSCHEEDEDDNCYETERYSPSFHHPENKPYALPGLPSQSEHQLKDCKDLYFDGREKILDTEGVKSKENKGKESHRWKSESGNNNEEHLSFSPFENNTITQSLSDYLYFQHRNKSLKNLLERKMEKQAVFLGI